MNDNLGIREENTNTNTKTDEVYRIAVTREAEKALNELLEKVNHGFEGGKVNRTEMASWALGRMSKDFDDVALQDIRAEHFDEIAALESLWRKAKETGKVSSEMKLLLLRQTGFDGSGKKTGKLKIDR